MKKLIFKLSDMEYINIIPDYNLNFNEISFCCDELKIYFINKYETMRIGQNSTGELFEHFITRLKKALNNELQIHESITENLGIMQNKYCRPQNHNKSDFFMISSPDGECKYWIGTTYEMWTTFNDANPYVNTWLYNDKLGNIILEVTPFYKWSMQDNEDDDPNFITYEEFIKNYKPLILKVIPHDIAIKWLNQAIKMYRSFFKNEKDYTRACKENNW